MADEYIGLGVAGNWRGHLSQIGGSDEYSEVKTDDEFAPKGLFPWFVKNSPGALGRIPISTDSLSIPAGVDIHPEPELILDCKIEYNGSKITDIVPMAFSAFNDASIRNSNESVTAKKNFGNKTKGLCEDFVPIESFDESCILEYYTIASWLKRDRSWNLYSDFCDVKNYEYFYDKLVKWLIDSLNNQQKNGPLEDLSQLLRIGGMPKRALISIGATHYTDYGTSNYLSAGDEYLIALFDKRVLTEEAIINALNNNTLITEPGCLVLHQTLVPLKQR